METATTRSSPQVSRGVCLSTRSATSGSETFAKSCGRNTSQATQTKSEQSRERSKRNWELRCVSALCGFCRPARRERRNERRRTERAERVDGPERENGRKRRADPRAERHR